MTIEGRQRSHLVKQPRQLLHQRYRMRGRCGEVTVGSTFVQPVACDDSNFSHSSAKPTVTRQIFSLRSQTVLSTSISGRRSVVDKNVYALFCPDEDFITPLAIEETEYHQARRNLVDSNLATSKLTRAILASKSSSIRFNRSCVARACRAWVSTTS